MARHKQNKNTNLKVLLSRMKFFVQHIRKSPANLIYLIIIIICFSFVLGTIDRNSKNQQLSQTYEKLLKQQELLAIEVETLELDNEYYKTTEYQELAARRLANKKLPGENLVYLPENSIVAKEKHTTKPLDQDQSYTNLEKWQLFFFPPNPNS